MRQRINLGRSIGVADYILEDNGHTIMEAAKEFEVSKSTIERDLNLLGAEAFYGTNSNVELKRKYKMVRLVLKRLATENQKKAKLKKDS